MATIRLHDEAPSKQDVQCQELGADFYPEDEENEPAYGADPFDILAHKQETTQ